MPDSWVIRQGATAMMGNAKRLIFWGKSSLLTPETMFLFNFGLDSFPLGQKSLETPHEPMGVCFKLWVKKSLQLFCSLTSLARWGCFFGIPNQTLVANSHTAFCQLFRFSSGKCVFVQKVPKHIIQITPRKGPVFGHMGVQSLCLPDLIGALVCGFQTEKNKVVWCVEVW